MKFAETADGAPSTETKAPVAPDRLTSGRRTKWMCWASAAGDISAAVSTQPARPKAATMTIAAWRAPLRLAKRWLPEIIPSFASRHGLGPADCYFLQKLSRFHDGVPIGGCGWRGR